MASIDKNKLISKLGYVAYFNEKVWGQINSTAGGNIYHAGADITLNKDKITNVTADEEGRYIKTGETPISIKRMPKFSSTGYTGGNTTSGSVAFSDMDAIRPEHLKTLNADDRQMFTIYDTDIPSQVIIADELYACCFNVIRKLISIRPFTASWQHDSSVANKKINEKFNGGSYAYGVFIDNPSVNTNWTKDSGSGIWGAGGTLSRWQITLGGNISALKLTEASVTRNGVYAGNAAVASSTVTMVSNFWTAWSDRCKARNSFDYKFFSCHLNCHSSCHSSCHGSRSRR